MLEMLINPSSYMAVLGVLVSIIVMVGLFDSFPELPVLITMNDGSR
jgi:hypothetical protein